MQQFPDAYSETFRGHQIYNIKQNKYVKSHPCLKQQCLQMVSIYNFENTGRKLKPDHLIWCINVFIE